MYKRIDELKFVNPTSPAKVDIIALRQVSWLKTANNAFPIVDQWLMLNAYCLFTVAGQHRNFTGFPILPDLTGHRKYVVQI